MDEEDEQTVRDVVEEILAKADMDSITEKEVRKLAAVKTGLDLSKPPGKEFVLSVIKSFLAAQDEAQASAAAAAAAAVEVAATPPESNEEEEEEVPRDRAKHQKGSAIRDNRPEKGPPVKRAKQVKRREVEDDDDFLDDDFLDDEDEEEEEHGKQEKTSKYEKDEQGNIIICELSAKRKVVVSQFKGRTLISLREYYEKDGKMLPSSKGISLTQEQFEKLAKSSKDIEAAISNMR